MLFLSLVQYLTQLYDIHITDIEFYRIERAVHGEPVLRPILHGDDFPTNLTLFELSNESALFWCVGSFP